MKRVVKPERLDELPHDHPDAIGSRRDIQRLNRVMGNGEIMKQLLLRGLGSRVPQRIVELGAGDGTLVVGLAKQFSSQWKNVQVVLIDRKNALSAGTRAEIESSGWAVEMAVADVFDWLQKSAAPADIMIANLFLHHFRQRELAKLLGLVATRTHVFTACEPRRSSLALTFSRMVGFIGCNAVTRHDAVVSVRAGFDGNELSAAWPQDAGWRLHEQDSRLFTHSFLAERTGAI